MKYNYDYELVGRFPLDFTCKIITDVIVALNGHCIVINENEFDSPTFLYRSNGTFYIQLASYINESMVLINERDVMFYDSSGNEVDLFEIPVKPLGIS